MKELNLKNIEAQKPKTLEDECRELDLMFRNTMQE